MIDIIKKNNRGPVQYRKRKLSGSGFVMLFAVTLSSIILAIALGITNIALREVIFGTSAESTNNAFVAADTGAECALFYDKLVGSSFPIAGPATAITCASTTTTPSFSGTADTGSYDFIIPGLGVLGTSCAKINVFKNKGVSPTLVTITSTGYNIGDSNCNSTNLNRVERELKITFRAGVPPPPPGSDGSGGIVTNITVGPNNYRVHKFISSGTFVVPTSGVSSVEYLVVGGGGGGGYGGMAGGGAGGFRSSSLSVNSGQSYPITVGGGGAGPTTTAGAGSQGLQGGNSVFSTITAAGGGGGGGRWCPGDGPSPTSGGSGGGGAAAYLTGCSTQTMAGAAGNTPSTSPAQGFAGGSGSPLTSNAALLAGGGGGGAGGAGIAGSAGGVGGNGGAGAASAISGTSTFYASGGAGGGSSGNGTASAGGGGVRNVNGADNTGGGGGSTDSVGSLGVGGSGIVIIRYIIP